MSDEYNSPNPKQLNYRKPTPDNRFRLPYNVSLIFLLWSSEKRNLFNKFLFKKVECVRKLYKAVGGNRSM